MTARRDESGPDHKPIVNYIDEINGVVTSRAPYVRYLEDNLLTELFRPDWVGVFADGEAIEHLYTVLAPTGGARREWYFHEHTTDRYMILSGLLDVGLYDGREESVTFGNFIVVSLGEPGSEFPNAIRIPPNVWHSLKWESEIGLLLNAKLPGYERVSPDKFRVSPADYPDSIIWNN